MPKKDHIIFLLRRLFSLRNEHHRHCQWLWCCAVCLAATTAPACAQQFSFLTDHWIYRQRLTRHVAATLKPAPDFSTIDLGSAAAKAAGPGCVIELNGRLACYFLTHHGRSGQLNFVAVAGTRRSQQSATCLNFAGEPLDGPSIVASFAAKQRIFHAVWLAAPVTDTKGGGPPLLYSATSADGLNWRLDGQQLLPGALRVTLASPPSANSTSKGLWLFTTDAAGAVNRWRADSNGRWLPDGMALQPDAADLPSTKIDSFTPFRLSQECAAVVGIAVAGRHFAEIATSQDGRAWHRSDDRLPIQVEQADSSLQADVCFTRNPPLTIGDRWILFSAVSPDEPRLNAFQTLCDRLVGRGTVAGDGFVWTQPFVLNGTRITVNADVSRGELSMELQDEDGTPFTGFRRSDFTFIHGDSVRHEARWGKHSDLRPLLGKRVRLKFDMSEMTVFGFTIQ